MNVAGAVSFRASQRAFNALVRTTANSVRAAGGLVNRGSLGSATICTSILARRGIGTVSGAGAMFEDHGPRARGGGVPQAGQATTAGARPHGIVSVRSGRWQLADQFEVAADFVSSGTIP